MAAATEDRNTSKRLGDLFSYLVGADEVIPAGVIVGADANGFAENAVAGSASVLGRSEEAVTNLDGANGDQTIEVLKGRFLFENDGVNPVVQADVGQQATLVDNQTVATPGGAGPNAGRIESVSTAGVWVDMRDIALIEESA